MDLLDVIGPVATQTDKHYFRLDVATVEALSLQRRTCTLHVRGQSIPNCSFLDSYRPVRGDKVIYVVNRYRGIVVLGSINRAAAVVRSGGGDGTTLRGTASGTGRATLTFPEGVFSAPPHVMVTSTTPGVWFAVIDVTERGAMAVASEPVPAGLNWTATAV